MASFKIAFPDFYDDLAALEIESKGFLDDVRVDLEDGRRFVLCFRDSWNVQLEHDATGATANGTRYLALPNLIVIESVARSNIVDVIQLLSESGFFDRLGTVAIR